MEETKISSKTYNNQDENHIIKTYPSIGNRYFLIKTLGGGG